MDALVVRLGAPLAGIYDGGEPPDGPQTHHFIKGTEANWALDISANPGTPVRIHLLPVEHSARVTARVELVSPVCGPIRAGGEQVRVGVFIGSERIGSVTYAHLKPSVAIGQEVAGDGGVVGTVRGGLVAGPCWTGPHVHVQAYNVRGFSCFDGTLRHDQPISEGISLGLVGSLAAKGVRQRCR